MINYVSMCAQEEIPNPRPNFLMNQANLIGEFSLSGRSGSGLDQLHRPPLINRREIIYLISFSYFNYIC